MKNKAVHKLIEVKADQTGDVVIPDRIHLMSTGHWHTPWHGAFEMTVQDLKEMVKHFAEGIGLVEGSKRAPINYGHDQGGKAAGWINTLTVEGDDLMGDIEWTPAGRQALQDGEYRYISPEWNPRDFPWENPQAEGEVVDNVFNGAALTNIPLFTKLKPVMASRDGSNGGSDTSNDNQGEDMDLSEVRAKKLDELTDDEKAFLAEHRDELTDEERTTFELTDSPEEPETPETPETSEEPEQPETPEVQASRKGGVSIDADQLAQLKADAKAGREAQQLLASNAANAVMASAIRDGKVKQDQKEAGVALLLADRDGKFKSFVEALPKNELLASEHGADNSAETSASDELSTKVQDVMKADSLSYSKAMRKVLAADRDLAKRVDAERKQ